MLRMAVSVMRSIGEPNNRAVSTREEHQALEPFRVRYKLIGVKLFRIIGLSNEVGQSKGRTLSKMSIKISALRLSK